MTGVLGAQERPVMMVRRGERGEGRSESRSFGRKRRIRANLLGRIGLSGEGPAVKTMLAILPHEHTA